MKRLLMLTAMTALCVWAFAPTAFASPSGGGFQAGTTGGFSGPGPATVTVEQAKTMRDDAPVTLRGNVIQHLGKDDYLFKDATGTIRVEIDHDKWGGLNITPNDTVELHGEVDKDWNSVEIEVARVAKVQ